MSYVTHTEQHFVNKGRGAGHVGRFLYRDLG